MRTTCSETEGQASCHTLTSSAPINHPSPPLFLEERALHSDPPKSLPPAGEISGLWVEVAPLRGQKAWDLVFREMQNETEVELSIIPDSFLPTEAIGYKKTTQWLSGCARGVV